MTSQSDLSRVVWYLSGHDGRDHAVTDREFLRARTAGDAQYESVCGHWVRPMPCVSPPGPQCDGCRRYLAARASLPDLADRLNGPAHRAPSLWRRLFRRPGRSAAAQSTPS